MELEPLLNYLLKKPGALEDFPFGPEHAVYKVAGKMFALVSLGEVPLRMNLKCDPDHALSLREYYPAVSPGYHMNKRHWNTLTLDGTIPEEELFSMIDDSYALVVGCLKKGEREALQGR